MLLCRSGSTFFFPVTVLLVPGDFPHAVLISFSISARYLQNRQIGFREKAGGLFRRGQLPPVLNLDECCYYYRFHLFSIKNEKDSAKHFLIMSLPVLKHLRGFLILYLAVFLFVYVQYGTMS